jgi:large subunit ribosomal protein L3
VRDAVKKRLPDAVPKPGKFRLPGAEGEAPVTAESAAAAETPAAEGA